MSDHRPGGRQRRRVAYLHDNVEFGGIETLQLQILRHLDLGRFDPVVVHATEQPSSSDRFEEYLAEAGVKLLKPADVPSNALSGVRRVVNLARLLRDERVDVAHIQTRTPTSARRLTLGSGLARVSGVVRSEHVSPGPSNRRLTRYAVRPFDWMTDVVMTDSLGDRREQIELVGRKPSKVQTSYCGIDPHQFVPVLDSSAAKRDVGIDPSTFVIGTVGRLHEQKGQRYLIEAFAALPRDTAQPTKLLLVGDGPEEESLRALAERNSLGDRVIFAGFQPEPLVYMNAMDVVAMPSLWEGFSISMQQFMALGKAMVVSDHHSFREAITNAEHGLIVPTRDSGALASAIANLFGDAELRGRLGGAARERALRQFSIQAHVNELMDTYDALLAPGAQ